MKKIYSIILLIALAISGTIRAGELKIGINDTSSKYAPVYGSDADRYQYHNQTIFLASELTALANQQITKITFFQKSTTSSDFANVQISLKEVSNSSFEDVNFISTADAQVVYTGSLPSTSTELEVTLSSPFVYQGGNLLIDVQKTQPSGGGYGTSSWKGFQATSKSTYLVLYGAGTTSGLPSEGNRSMNRSDIKFTYEEAGSANCAKPTLTPGDVTAKTAAFSWTAGGEETSWQYVCLPATEKVNWEGVPTTTNTSATVENLAANTAYKFYLRAYCGAEDQSGDVTSSFTTLKSCYEPTNLSVSNETIEGATISWAASGKGETQYQYTYAVYDGTANWEDAVTTSELSATLSGLNSATPYQVWVRSYCGAEDQSEAITQYFTTLVDCSAKELPLNEDFSSNIDCWKMVDCTGSTGVSSGKFQFCYTKTPPMYLISPELVVTENQVKVEFDYWCYSSSNEESFQVGYSTTTNETEAFTWGDEYKTTNTNSASPDKFSEIFPAGAKYICIKYTANYKYYLYIDNFSASEYEAPACAVPTELAASEITANSAKIAWTSEATAWKVQTSTDGENWTDVAGEITNPYVLTDLAENTKYYVHVCANCGANGDSEWTKAISFTTECAVKTLPFGPESFSEGTLPGCWSAASQWAAYPYEGNSMRFNASTTADLTLPAIALNDKAQLTFRRQSSYVSCSVYVNYGEGEKKLADFEKSSSWALSTVDLSDYEGKTVTLIIRGNYYGSYRYLYIDDVAVDYLPVATPTNVVATPANGSAVVTWERAEESATDSLRYRVKDAEPEAEWIKVTGIEGKTYTIESLVNGTTYEVQVKTVVSEKRQSEWTASAVVTPQSCPTVNSIELSEKTFSSVKVSWTTSGAGTWMLQYGVNSAMTIVHDLAVTEYVITSMTAGENYTIKVLPECASEGQETTYTPVYTAPASAAVASISDATAAASWEAVADAPNGYKYVVVAKDATPDWHSEAVQATSELSANLVGLSAMTEYDFYVAALYGETLSPATKASFTTTTVAPKNLTLSAVTATTATLAWEYEGAATAYEYAVGNDPDALEWNGVTEKTKTLGDLTANTSYTFHVRAAYENGAKSDSIKLTFRTDCSAITELPWNEGFEEYETGSTTSAAPACWAFIGVNEGAYPYAYVAKNSTYTKSGSQTLYITASSSRDAYVILPKFEDALNGLQVSFWHKEEHVSNSAVLTLGYITDITDAETFVAIQEFGRKTTWQEEAEISLAAIPNEVATTARLAFKLGKAKDYYYSGIDDITVTKLPTCRKPALGETTILPDGATFTWTAGNGETKFQYAVGNDPDALEWKAIEATEATVHGLVPGNNYNFYVRAFCDPEVSDSVWTAFAPVCNAPTEAALAAATTTTATFSWTAAANITSYQYVVMAKGEAADWNKAKTTNNTTAEWTELTASTLYDFYVRSYFNETVQSAAASLSFQTECDVKAALGYTEGFEGMEVGNYEKTGLLCWDELNAVHTSGSCPQVYVNTESTYVKSGSKSLYFITSNSTNVYAILPALSGSFNGLQMTFWHKEENATASGAITLGYFTNIENEETFVSLKECERKTKEWQEEIVNLSSVPADVRLAFRCGTGNKNYYVGIDDISITEIPSCAVPTGLTAGEVTAATATLSWTSEADNFKVQYTADKANWGEEHVVSAKTYALEGLEEQTTYYARVKAVCGSENESEYCEEISFTTLCAAKAMPYAESFEDGVPACWETTGSWTTNSEYAHSGNALRANVKNKAATLTMPAIAISEADAELVFYVRNVYSSSSYVSGEVIITPAVGEAKHVAVINSNDADNKQKVDLSEFNGQNVVISFSFSSVSSTTAYVSIDEVSVAKKQCATPTDVQATAGDSKAEVEWNAGDDETEWQVRYKATAAEEWKEVEGTITTTTYSITGLSNGTQYEVQVRAYCDETHQSDWTAPVTFTPSEPTGFEHINGGDKAVKVMKNGVLYIIRDGVQYNAQGARVMDN